MKILFLGDYSNYHNALAQGLRKLGHECLVASDGDAWKDTPREIDLLRHPGLSGKAHYGLKLLSVLPRLRGYDYVYLVNPQFLALHPRWLRPIYGYLRRNNGKIILSAMGNDFAYIDACYGQRYRYSDYMVGDQLSPYALSDENGKSAWGEEVLRRYHYEIIHSVDGVMSCLYEYCVAYSGVVDSRILGYGGIPINIEDFTPRYITEVPEKVKFFIGIQRKRNKQKGTDLLLDALRRVHDRYPDRCEMKVVESLPYGEYLEAMRGSHVVLDQLYSYTPATNALTAMAMGMVAVSGAEPEYYDYIGEHELHPIVNVSPLIGNDIYDKLEWIVLHKEELPRLSRESREFVIKHNDSQLVARRHEQFWKQIGK